MLFEDYLVVFYLPLCYNDSKLKEGRDKCVQEKNVISAKGKRFACECDGG